MCGRRNVWKADRDLMIRAKKRAYSLACERFDAVIQLLLSHGELIHKVFVTQFWTGHEATQIAPTQEARRVREDLSNSNGEPARLSKELAEEEVPRQSQRTRCGTVSHDV